MARVMKPRASAQLGRAGGVGGLGGRFNVDNVPGGVHRRFDPHHGGFAGPDRFFQGAGLGLVKQGQPNAAPFRDHAQPVLAAVIHHLGRHNVLSGAHGLKQR